MVESQRSTPKHTAPLHWSLSVGSRPSSQGVPASATTPWKHSPLRHSAWVHALSSVSEHVVPSANGVNAGQSPFMHRTGWRHSLGGAAHVTSIHLSMPPQAPDSSQVSFRVDSFESSQIVPKGLKARVWHLPRTHAAASLQRVSLPQTTSAHHSSCFVSHLTWLTAVLASNMDMSTRRG